MKCALLVPRSICCCVKHPTQLFQHTYARLIEGITSATVNPIVGPSEDSCVLLNTPNPYKTTSTAVRGRNFRIALGRPTACACPLAQLVNSLRPPILSWFSALAVHMTTRWAELPHSPWLSGCLRLSLDSAHFGSNNQLQTDLGPHTQFYFR